jgi:hypothetical protein
LGAYENTLRKATGRVSEGLDSDTFKFGYNNYVTKFGIVCDCMGFSAFDFGRSQSQTFMARFEVDVSVFYCASVYSLPI